MSRTKGSRNTHIRRRGIRRDHSHSHSLGLGRGNWKGGAGVRKSYETRFNVLVEELCAKTKPRFYEPTLRGLQEVLVIDGETFNRYRQGLTEVPTVVIKHMEALRDEEIEFTLHPAEWALLNHFSIEPVFQPSPETGEIVELLKIEYEHWTFFTRPFPVNQNRKFREALFQNTGKVSYPLHSAEWAVIVDQALTGVYRGELSDSLWKRKPKPLPDLTASESLEVEHADGCEGPNT